MIAASIATWLLATLAVSGAWFFFRQFALTRPPLGTVNLADVGFTLGCIVALPFLYLWLPGWIAGSILTVTTFSILWFLVEPVTPVPVLRWVVAGGLVVADILLAAKLGTASTAFLLVNNVAIILVAIGVSMMWAQGGLRARDMAILAGAIAIYDLVATGFLPLTSEMIDRLSLMPFLPMAVWPAGTGEWVGIGLGDLLMAAVGPLVLRKAFGRRAGLVAIAVALGSIALVLGIVRLDALPATFPTMVVLGPLLVAQYLLARRHLGPERTTARYLSDEPRPALPGDGVPAPVVMTAASRPGYIA